MAKKDPITDIQYCYLIGHLLGCSCLTSIQSYCSKLFAIIDWSLGLLMNIQKWHLKNIACLCKHSEIMEREISQGGNICKLPLQGSVMKRKLVRARWKLIAGKISYPIWRSLSINRHCVSAVWCWMGGGGERHQQDEQFDGLGRRFFCSYKWAACYRLSATLVGYLSAAS